MLSSQSDHWHARAWVDTASNKEQIAKLRALFRCFEGEVPSSVANYAVNRAPIRGVASLDVDWRPKIFDDDVAAQIGKTQTLELVETEFFKRNVVFARVG